MFEIPLLFFLSCDKIYKPERTFAFAGAVHRMVSVSNFDVWGERSCWS